MECRRYPFHVGLEQTSNLKREEIPFSFLCNLQASFERVSNVIAARAKSLKQCFPAAIFKKLPANMHQERNQNVFTKSHVNLISLKISLWATLWPVSCWHRIQFPQQLYRCRHIWSRSFKSFDQHVKITCFFPMSATSRARGFSANSLCYGSLLILNTLDYRPHCWQEAGWSNTKLKAIPHLTESTCWQVFQVTRSLMYNRCVRTKWGL